MKNRDQIAVDGFRDGTEYGIANELINAGIPKNQIVLAFQPADIRQYTEFAVT